MLRDALVVGISSYQHLPALNAPAADAEAIAHQLETYGDFQVTRLPEIVQAEKLRVGVKTPVTLATLESALVKLFKPRGATIPQTALFYFSGHGLQKDAGIHEGYLATSDANPNAHFHGLSLFWLRRLLQESPVRQRIVLLDCCHSGEMLNFLEADPGAKAGTDRLFMAASREYESAYETLTGQYSVFTQAVLDGIDPRRLPTGVVTNYALTDWVSTALKGESQQPLFENSGGEIILTRCQSPLTIKPTLTPEICPYRGLEPFEEGHAEYFFGRETLTDQLVDRLRTENFLAVVGASGSGKSSLVRAGLVHKLQRGQALSGSDRWQIRVITPTEHPFKSLANAFVNPDAAAIDRAEQLQRTELLLQEGGSGLTHLIHASLMSATKTARFVLIIDQFEETFTLCQGHHAELYRQRFFNCLLAALRETDDRFRLVIVLRADFFSKCSFYKELAEQIEHHLITVTPLGYEQIKASILKPAEKVGVVCEPNLVYNILLDIAGAPGELPLLQYTLLELWHRRHQEPDSPVRLTLNAYTQLGGVRGTLEKRANEIFYSLSLEEQRVAKRIFIALTQLGEGTEDTRRRVLKSELVTPQFPAELVEQVLEKLVGAKLVVMNQVVSTSYHQQRVDQQFANVSTALRLAQVVRQRSSDSAQTVTLAQSLLPLQTSTQDYGTTIARLSQTVDLNSVQPVVENVCCETVDIAHETLIRHWALLRSWLDENREMLRRQRQIERTAREWKASDQPRSLEFLLHGSRLLDAEDFVRHYPNELSTLAQRYITISQTENQRNRREARLLQVSIPGALLVALGITFGQYQIATRSQMEKDFQLQVATSRQWSAIAQSILQEPEGDPTTALLISRLAAERGKTYEAEASLRLALQTLRLQAHLQTTNALVQFALSPHHDRLATLSRNGTVQVWSVAESRLEREWRWQEPTDRRSADPTFSFLQFTPDGTQIMAVASQSTELRIWSVESGELQQRLGGQTKIADVALSSRRGLVAIGSGNAIKVWELATGRLGLTWTAPDQVQKIWFNASATQLGVAHGRSVAAVSLANARSQRLIQTEPISSIAVSPNHPHLAIVDRQGRVQFWHTATGALTQIVRLSIHNRNSAIPVTTQAMFSPDGRQLAVTNTEGQVAVIQMASGRQWTVEPPTRQVRRSTLPPIAFSPDSQTLVIAERSDQETASDRVSIRDANTGQELGNLRGYSDAIHAIQFTADGSLITTASPEGSVHLWAAAPGGELPSLKLAQSIQWASFHQPTATPTPGAETPIALSTVESQVVKHWELTQRSQSSTGQALPPNPALLKAISTISLRTQVDPKARLTGVAASADGKMFAIASSSGKVGIWQTPPDQPPDQAMQLVRWLQMASPTGKARSHPVKPNSIDQLVFSPDGQQLVGVGADKILRVWTVASGQLLHQLVGHEALVERVQFSPDGHHIVSASWDHTARVWNSASGALVSTLNHTDAITSAQFSPDSRRVLLTSLDGTASVVDATTGALQVILTGHRGALLNGNFSPDGQQVVTASADGTARLWDATTGVERSILRPTQADQAQDPVRQAFFDPTGRYVATLTQRGTLHLWAATWEGLVELAHDRSLRQLKPEECLRYLRLAPTDCPALTLRTRP